jgi:hypothetical protein
VHGPDPRSALLATQHRRQFIVWRVDEVGDPDGTGAWSTAVAIREVRAAVHPGAHRSAATSRIRPRQGIRWRVVRHEQLLAMRAAYLGSANPFVRRPAICASHRPIWVDGNWVSLVIAGPSILGGEF